jgi:hypothetical protein
MRKTRMRKEIDVEETGARKRRGEKLYIIH